MSTIGGIMDEEQPKSRAFVMITQQKDELSSPLEEEPPQKKEEVTMEERSADPKKKSPWIWIGAIGVIGLIVAGLFLPPVSLGKRLAGDDETAVAESTPELTAETTNTDTESTETETEMEAAVAPPTGVAVAVSNGTAVTVAAKPAAEYAAPADKTIKGDVYAIEGSGAQGQITLPIPADTASVETLDLYGWDGAAWTFVPNQKDTASQKIMMREGEIPQALAIMEATAPASPAIAARVESGESLPAELLPQITEVSLSALKPVAGGALEGEVAEMPTGGYEQYLHISNRGPIIDLETLGSILNDPAIQSVHISSIVQTAAEGEYAGVNLDYQGVAIPDRDSYTAFVVALADALRAQNQKLAVTLPMPFETGNMQWDAVNYDWAAIGQTADIVYMEMPLDPTAYDEGEDAHLLLDWASGYISRDKLTPVLTSSAIDRIGESFLQLSNEEALANFGELQFIQGGEEVLPNTAVEVALSGTASPLEWDGESLTYKYSYEENGQTHHVWLDNAAALRHRAERLLPHQVRGIAVSNLGDVTNGPGYSSVFTSYAGDGEAPQPAGAAIVWTVENADGSILASSSGDALTFAWDGAEAEGVYAINAEFAMGDNIASLGAVDVAVSETAGSEAEVAEETTEEAATEEVTEEETETEEVVEETTEETTSSAIPEGDNEAVVNVGANVRLGPGLTYGTIAGGVNPDEVVTLIGRNSDISWYNIIMPDGETEGWIYYTLVNTNPNFQVSSLPVATSEAPATAGGGGGTDGGSGTTAPPPVSAPPVANGNFELGGQTHGFANPTLMSYAGMNWVKFQHKWGESDNPGDLAGRINQAHANGFKVLLSIPGSPYPSSINFGAYATFVGGVAALGPDAIEIWNEENIDFEWPAGQIDPASYVNNMLAPAYNSIKAANPSVMVIAGAPAPTGYFGGGCSANGCDDSAFLAGMAAAGAANYMDCMGAHYNAGATSPYQSSGHPAGGTHYSWYFQPMLDLYANSFGKPVCFTELGYLSGEDYGGVPSRFAWAGGTTVGQHAQWLAEAVSLAANSGRVRMAIVFNVDFTQWGDDPQAGFAMIRADGGCPACDTLRAVMGGG